MRTDAVDFKAASACVSESKCSDVGRHQLEVRQTTCSPTFRLEFESDGSGRLAVRSVHRSLRQLLAKSRDHVVAASTIQLQYGG